MFEEFENLPNLHINLHLVFHAKNYGTLVNVQVGNKEMVHKIFKDMVTRTNKKNIELDMMKRYTTLYAMRHLTEGGIDWRLSRSNDTFKNISQEIRCLFTTWLEKEPEIPEDDSIGFSLQFYETPFGDILLQMKII
jgi:hypothetical protein